MGTNAFVAKALGDIARAKGMAQVACDAGLSRESLYKALSGERNPTLDTVLRVIGALGLKFRAEAVLDSEATAPAFPEGVEVRDQTYVAGTVIRELTLPEATGGDGGPWGAHGRPGFLIPPESAAEIHILMFDINDDGFPEPGEPRIVGFFFGKDLFLRNPALEFTGASNERLMFYLDAPSIPRRASSTFSITSSRPTRAASGWRGRTCTRSRGSTSVSSRRTPTGTPRWAAPPERCDCT